MDTPDNYYAILGVPVDADYETLKRAYRQLARRYHPDLAGAGAAVQMKRINRAYDVLSDVEKRLNYDTIIGGVIDLRRGGMTRPRPKQRKFDPADDIEFSGLSIFSTKGPLHTGPVVRSSLGVVSALSSVLTARGMYLVAGSLDGKGKVWRVGNEEAGIQFAAFSPLARQQDAALPVESLRELRLSAAGGLLAGWGKLGLHVWDSKDGSLLWSYALGQRAVSAHYSLDVVLMEAASGKREAMMALPMLPVDIQAPRQWGVRASDVVRHALGQDDEHADKIMICAEEEVKSRQFWAIRLRSLAQNGEVLLTLSCAHVPGEQQEMAIVRRWDLTAKTRLGGKLHPQITSSVLAGFCADCGSPYAVTPDVRTLVFVHAGSKVRIYDTIDGVYSELPSGTMGGSAKLAISPDGGWLAIAREDSEVNEGVIDVWSLIDGRLVQKLYHPWQISALHFAERGLVVALTDGTIQVWE